MSQGHATAALQRSWIGRDVDRTGKEKISPRHSCCHHHQTRIVVCLALKQGKQEIGMEKLDARITRMTYGDEETVEGQFVGLARGELVEKMWLCIP